jgi:hypothetical protein
MTMDRRAALIALAALAGPLTARAAAQGTGLQYLLTIEQFELALYERARELDLSGQAAALAGRYANHEAEHVERLRIAVGSEASTAPVELPKFGVDDFTALAQRAEGLAVSALNGAIPTVRDTALREELAAIVQVDARHGAAIRDLRGNNPAPRSRDPGIDRTTAEHVLELLQAS